MGRAFEYRRAAKEKRWDKMSKIFPKLVRAIVVAVREGGPDPELNSRLRLAIMNAKAQNMPKDNVDGAIKRAISKDMVNYEEICYEGKGPHGSMFMIDCATDNTNRTIVNLRLCFNKSGGQIVDSGSLQFLFRRRAVVEFPLPADRPADEIELALIDHGLDEMTVNEGTAYAYGEVADFGRLTKGVEELGLQITKASLQRLPTVPVELSEDQMEQVEQLIDRIEDDDDVQAVYTNIA